MHIRVEYTYNAEGIHTSKTYYDDGNLSNSYRLEYLLNGSQIVSEGWDNCTAPATTRANLSPDKEAITVSLSGAVFSSKITFLKKTYITP